MLRARFVWPFLLALACHAVLGCDNTPTVPVPPPEMEAIVVGPPDGGDEGNVTVTGASGASGAGDVVMVFDVDLGAGVMVEAEEDGSFEVIIWARVGDELVIQIKRGGGLSDEQTTIVPSG